MALDMSESMFKVQEVILGDDAGLRREEVKINEKVFLIHPELLSGRAEDVSHECSTLTVHITKYKGFHLFYLSIVI